MEQKKEKVKKRLDEMENGIRETFDLKIASVQKDIRHLKGRIKRERELTETKAGLLDKALTLQFNEYERRLTALNHEAQRLSLMIPRLEFDLVVDQLKKELKEIHLEVKELQLWRSNVEGRQARAQWIAIASAIISAIAIVKSFFK